MTDICDVCNGTRKNFFNEVCTYCNGTGRWNEAAQAYLNNHICQCIAWNREHCPVCHKLCHHSSSQTSKQRIIPGYGGESSSVRIEAKDITVPEEMPITT